MTYEEYLQNKFAYQEEGEQLLVDKKHACLFYKMGKGKTYPTITAMREVAMDGKCLILSTSDSIKKMWQVEIVPQGILPKQTELLTFTAAIQENTKRRLLKEKFDCIVIDECHKIKSNSSKISKLCYMLTRKCKYVFGLTGTPRGNSDLDIFCEFHNMNVAYFGDISYSRFVEECCDVDNKFFGGRAISIPIGINERYKAGFDRVVSMYSQRIDYIEEDDMPPLRIMTHYIPFEPTEEYKKAEQGIIAIDDYASTVTKLVAINKMHQAANGYLYTDDFDIEGKRTTTITEFKKNDKLEWLQHNVNDEPTVIVYRFVKDLYDLQKQYPTATEDITLFKQGKSKVLLLQCSRCESFNLQMCSRMIFYTLDYSYIKFSQMLHRIWRRGQESDCLIDVLVFGDSIETKIWNTVQNKKRLADLFMSIKGA
jgi:SNF2 family DNA or RNA helicase